MVPWFAWVGFLIVLVSFLAVDLSLHRDAKAMPVPEALRWTLAWVAIALGFGGVIWWWRGAETAGEFVAAYLIEWSLSVDNVFVFILVMAQFAVPEAYQHRVLFWGVLGAIVMRLGFILAGAALLHRFEWMALVFGAILLATAIRFLRERHGSPDPNGGALLRLTRGVVPLGDRYHGVKMLTRLDGKLLATPLLGAVIAVNLTDVVFAVDSIPAVFSVTRDQFVAFSSNALAILGLRSLYFVVVGAVGSFRHLRPALAAVLAFVALKMVLSPWFDVSVALSLGVIAAILAIGVGASLPRRAILIVGLVLGVTVLLALAFGLLL